MIYLKKGVKIAGLRPEMNVAVQIAAAVWKEIGNEDLWITSATDGNHSPGSLHYSGLAVDLRIRYFSPTVLKMVVNHLRLCLGAEFDVVVEKTHVHIEFQPKNQ